MKESIAKIWFSNGQILMKTDTNREFYLPLEVFPALYYASDEQRNEFYLWDDNRSIRWESLDEDIHISNFYETQTVNYDNEVHKLLSRFPYLDMKAFARYIDIHWTLLARLNFGIVKASAETLKKIRDGIKAIGKEMSAAVL